MTISPRQTDHGDGLATLQPCDSCKSRVPESDGFRVPVLRVTGAFLCVRRFVFLMPADVQIRMGSLALVLTNYPVWAA